MPSDLDKMQRLEKMLADELITREEFSKLKDELLSEAPESAETSEVGPPSVEPDTTWNREEEKQFISNLESRMSPDAVRGLGRHLNRVQLKGIARMNRDPYVLLYSLGHLAVHFQRLIDDAEPSERLDLTGKVFPAFCVHFHDFMKPPPDDDTEFDWYTGVSTQIWAAANEGKKS